MMAILDRLDEAATSGLNILSCERIVPIYADVIYQGTCNYSVSGFTWTFFSLLVVSFMGMLMITLRSSFKNNVVLVELDLTDEDSELYVMRKATQRGANQAQAADYDSQAVEEHDQWHKDSAARQDTSDSGSVYTDGELNVYTVDRNGSLEIAQSTSPKLYELEENSYDSRGKVVPSAPYAPDLGGDYDYSATKHYKSRVY